MANWKTDENGNIIVKDGNPIYLDMNNEERTIKAETVGNLNLENKKFRLAKESLEEKMKLYEGIDPEEARKAIQVAAANGNIDDIKLSIAKQYEEKLVEKENNYKELQNNYDKMLVDNVFANSEFIRNNVAVPRDMFEATFRNNFRVENGEVQAFDKKGNRIESKKNFGGYPADVEEALSILAESHPSREQILKANLPSGSGSTGGNGSLSKGKYLTRAAFNDLTPAQQSAMSKKFATGEIILT